MRKKNYKGRCEKRKLSKCEDVCRTFDAIQYAYVDLLNDSEDIKSFRVNQKPCPIGEEYREGIDTG